MHKQTISFSLPSPHASHINHGSQTITSKAGCCFWLILKSWWMTTSQSNPSACQHHLSKGINLAQPIPLCFPQPESAGPTILRRRHMKAGTEKNELHLSFWLWISISPTPSTSQAAQMMRDKIVTRLSRPQSHALELAYPRLQDDKTFMPVSLAACWHDEQKNSLRGI